MSWSGVKKHINNAEIEAWCEDMDIENYIINSQGDIDVNGNVDLDEDEVEFEKLPYKFGTVTGYFDMGYNKKLTSLENCPNKVGAWFSCSKCKNLESLEGCPKEVRGYFYCEGCKRKFTKEEVRSLCKVNGTIIK